MRRWGGAVLLACALALAVAVPAWAGVPGFLARFLGEGSWLESLLAPGPVNAKHVEVACLSCHRPFRGARSQTCLSGNCHPATKLAESEKPYVVAIHQQNTGRECTVCHPEHLGRQAAITISFHRNATLQAQRDCASCHGPQAEQAHPEIADRRCALCHVSTSDWKKVEVDHQKLADVACADCHGAQAREAHPEIRVADCTACHTSTSDWKQLLVAHERLGDACADCHAADARRAHPAITEQRCTACHQSTEDWKKVQVDHGKLGDAPCAGCHLADARKAHPAIGERRCTVCHTSTSDWGKVQFSHQAVAGQACATCHLGRKPKDGLHASLGAADCAACHRTSGWKPASFSHASLPAATRQQCGNCHLGRKPKDSLHANLGSTSCAACHVSTESWRRVNFDHARIGSTPCASCHRPPSTGIHPLAQGTSCSVCHTTQRWTPTSFRHPRIPEMREHMQLGCRACHPTTLSQAVPCSQCHGRGGFFEDD